MSSIYKTLAGKQEIMALYDAILSRWPEPYEAFNITTKHGDTFIIASGNASSHPLVLLHGSASNAVSWISDISEYSRYFRVYAVDLPGEPGKSAPNRLSLEGFATVEWMKDWMDYLRIERTTLLGISLGAWIGLKFAINNPEMVSDLILLAPAGVVQANRSFLLRAILYYLLRRWNKDISNRLNYGNQPITDDNLRFMDVIMDHFKPRFDTLPIFTPEELCRLNMPTLLIAGAKDTVFPTNKTARRLKELVPQVDIKILPEAGHVLYHMAPLVIPFLISKYKDPTQ